MYLRSKHIYFVDGEKDGYLVIEGKKIVGFLDPSASVTEYVDYTDYRIIPGLFDTHNHGTMGYSPAHEEDIPGYLKGLASQGTALVFPTVTYEKGSNVYHALAKLVKEGADGASVMGIHSEGPFGNRVGEKGIEQTPKPIDMQVIRDTVEHAEGQLRLMGFAPELPNSEEAIRYLTEHGVRVAFMHSNQNYQQALESFQKGITVATHTANVMSGIHHRNMGGLGACLLDADLECEVICDCLHNSAEMLELMFRVKQNMEKWMMISDSSNAAGAPEGRYMGPFGPSNITPEGFSLTDTGRLAGSTKPVLFGVKNLVERLHMPIETVLRMAALNPARVYGFDAEKGSIELGKDADLTIIDDAYQCMATYTNGRQVYDRAKEGDVFNPDYIRQFKLE